MIKYFKGNQFPGVTIAPVEPIFITIKRDYLISSIKEEFSRKIDDEQEFSNFRLMEILEECLTNYCDRIDKKCST